ncbi:hypothetical protein PDIG_75590 [Penicillium digitatum PHI26]|uniref:Uncharacterized protein n=2 Tax=Penicillium digitatum TaxID=36651 RepID=K9FCE4_PEND2|nr:hypothetical protein PDIP_46060 [Penicillium digitatum Pd1]EKV07045.1 hypothetical protein PDIG_75590 [Penicillium digitatum PHI26]EKV13922.1 hypothetical protein PDIP_46060 [Penicillium digitatum Pd1]
MTQTGVSDNCPRWHFRQCVLANIMSAGEKSLKSDFPSGEDIIIAQFNKAPSAHERLEMSL